MTGDAQQSPQMVFRQTWHQILLRTLGSKGSQHLGHLVAEQSSPGTNKLKAGFRRRSRSRSCMEMEALDTTSTTALLVKKSTSFVAVPQGRCVRGIRILPVSSTLPCSTSCWYSFLEMDPGSRGAIRMASKWSLEYGSSTTAQHSAIGWQANESSARWKCKTTHPSASSPFRHLVDALRSSSGPSDCSSSSSTGNGPGCSDSRCGP
mmetsp:Transcript_66679/g.111569  ORF Transcript_66679/g.111569 Transcript_66679/m.111569 type:complete len:206 (-) Transcript_66679:128-745(-)